MGGVGPHLLQERAAFRGAALRQEGAAQPHPGEVGLGRVEAREGHRPQRRDRVGGAPRGQQRVAAVEEERSPLRSAPCGKLAGEGDEARPGRGGLRGNGVLAVEPVEGRGGRGAIAEGEVRVAEAEQGGRCLPRAGRDDLLEGGHGDGELPRLLEELNRPRERRAGDGTRGFVPRGEVGAGGGVRLAQGLLRAPEREQGVIPQQGPLDVRVRQLGEGVRGAARFDEAQARQEPREAGCRGPRELVGHGDEHARRRGAVACGGVAQGLLGRVLGLGVQAPVRSPRGAGRGEEEEEAEAGNQEENAPYVDPRAVGSPPARMRTSSSWK